MACLASLVAIQALRHHRLLTLWTHLSSAPKAAFHPAMVLSQSPFSAKGANDTSLGHRPREKAAEIRGRAESPSHARIASGSRSGRSEDVWRAWLGHLAPKARPIPAWAIGPGGKPPRSGEGLKARPMHASRRVGDPGVRKRRVACMARAFSPQLGWSWLAMRSWAVGPGWDGARRWRSVIKPVDFCQCFRNRGKELVDLS
jgi:hypothetical protein